MYKNKRGKLTVVLCLMLVLSLLLMGCKPSSGGKGDLGDRSESVSKTSKLDTVKNKATKNKGREMSSEEIAEYLESRVVKIEVRSDEGGGTGSGFFIDDEGTIVTNFHVIDGMTSIVVYLSDGARYEIDTIVDFSPYLDVAVLKADISGNDYLEIADSYKQGMDVFAMGSPKGEANSFTRGTLSSTSRKLGLADFVQTDAAINPGNSGGPLVNSAGEVIGINSLSQANAEGMHFAIKMSVLDKLSMDKNFSMNEYREWYDTEVGRSYLALGEDYAAYTYVHTYTTVTGDKCLMSTDDLDSNNSENGYCIGYVYYIYPYTEEGYDQYRDYLREIGYTYGENIRDFGVEGGTYINSMDGYTIMLGIDTVNEYLIVTCPIY